MKNKPISNKPVSNKPVSNKIVNVSDAICVICFQNWERECRAFEIPHSEAEKISRKRDPRARCLIHKTQYGSYYKTVSPIRLIPEQGDSNEIKPTTS